MSNRVSDYLRHNVLGLVAIFIALGGVSWAATSLDRNSVLSKHIKNGQVKSGDVRDNGLAGADIADGAITGADIAPDSLTGDQIAENSLGTVPSADDAGTLDGIDSAAFQLRVDDACAAGEAIRAIAADGTVNCIAGATGDITGVTAGQGLTGGASSGVATLAADTSVLQRRIGAGCPAGQSIRAVAGDGTVTCEADDDSAATCPPGFPHLIASLCFEAADRAGHTFGSAVNFCRTLGPGARVPTYAELLEYIQAGSPGGTPVLDWTSSSAGDDTAIYINSSDLNNADGVRAHTTSSYVRCVVQPVEP